MGTSRGWSAFGLASSAASARVRIGSASLYLPAAASVAAFCSGLVASPWAARATGTRNRTAAAFSMMPLLYW